MISPYFYPEGGGLGHHVHYLAQYLSRLGCQVEILTTREFGESPSAGKTDLKKSLRLYTVFNSPITPGLFAKIPRIDADIIHAHGYFHFTTLLTSAICATQDRPIVVTTHGSWASNPRKEVLQLIYDRLAIRLFSTCQKVMAHTFFEKERLENAGLPSERIEVIYNGVDAERFNPKREKEDFRSRLNLSSSDSVILFVGRLKARKGCHILIRALARVAHKLPNTFLLVAGVGPELHRLNDLVKECGLPQNVLFLGKVSQEELSQVYAAADIVALPSTSGEGLPLVVLETMASQKPLVASAVGGIPELINMSKCGFLLPPSNVEKLAEAIVQLLANEEQMQLLGENGRKWVEKKFRWEMITRQVLGIYKEALNNRSHTRIQ